MAADQFPQLAEETSWGPTLPGGATIARYIGTNAALLEPAQGNLVLAPPDGVPVGSELNLGDAGQLLQSSLPLRAPSDSGALQPVDPEPEDHGSYVEPENATVEAHLPDELGDGIFLPEVGVKIEPEGAEGAAEARGMGDSAGRFYPELAADTDFIAEPTPLGVEAFYVLRSQDSPETHVLEFDLPPGAELALDGPGAVVSDGRETIARVSPPLAQDADGVPVPASMTVSGDELVIEVDFHGADVREPILVDPVIQAESYDIRASSADCAEEALTRSSAKWNWETLDANLGHNCTVVAFNTYSTANRYYDAGALAQWVWQAPPSTFIEGVDWIETYNLFSGMGGGVCTNNGIYDPTPAPGYPFGRWEDSAIEFRCANWNPQTFSQEVGSTIDLEATDAQGANGNLAIWQFYVPTSATRTAAAFDGFRAANIYLSDRVPPVFEEHPAGGGGWQDRPASYDFQAFVKAKDVGGVGVKHFWLLPPDPVDPSQLAGQGVSDSCAGVHGSNRCSDDDGRWSTTFSYKLPEGRNTISAVAWDQVLNATLSPEWTVSVDRTPPDVQAPAGVLYDDRAAIELGEQYSIEVSATDVAAGGEPASPSATPSAQNMRSGVAKVGLYVDGAGTPLRTQAFPCVTTTPASSTCGWKESKQWTIAASELGAGEHTIRVAAEDRVGHLSGANSKSFTVVVADRRPPQTQFDSGPSGVTPDSTPTFNFSADEPGSSFECRVDSGALASCSSPHTTISLSDGEHMISVRAIDAAGNIDAIPATRTFTVDTHPPETTLNSGPSGLTPDSTPTFEFNADEPGSSFECRVDSGAFTSCSSPHTTTSLSDGEHTIYVRATDAVGNVDASPATRTFTVDTVAPDTAIDSGPSGTSAGRSAVFAFSGDDQTTSFECSLDGAVFAGCTSPKTYRALSETEHTFRVRAADLAGNADTTPAASSFTPLGPLPETVITSGPDGFVDDDTPSFTFASQQSGATFLCSVDDGAAAPCESPLTLGPLDDGDHALEVRAVDQYGDEDPTPAARLFAVAPTPEPPEDPYASPSELDPSASSPVPVATEFLYDGDDPPQEGVEPGYIQPELAGVASGLVTNRAGSPIAGVTVSAPDFPELGSVRTDPDGHYYMAVNGGVPLRLRFEHVDYLIAERKFETAAQDYALAQDVALVPVDGRSTAVDVAGGSGETQVVLGSTVSDSDGTRQQVLIVPPGTSATAELPDGGEEDLDVANIRITEYTVGPGGLDAMPAELPRTTAYTYAMELSVDEAERLGAETVTFSNPIAGYHENFLDFPVGIDVPVGTYSREQGAWVPEEDGRVVRVVGESAGLADLDVTGSGQPAGGPALQALGVTSDERRELARLYETGDELWRVAYTHFSPKDHNFPDAAPGDAVGPPGTGAEAGDCEGEQPGSIIYCESQALGEEVGISGTDMRLSYRSDRAPGYKPTLDVPLIGETVPQSLQRIDLTVAVAGHQYRESFSNVDPDQVYHFTWDGEDAFGRSPVGPQTATVRLSYVYTAAGYAGAAPGVNRSFGLIGQGTLPNGLINSQTRWGEFVIDRKYERTIGSWDASSSGLGGWSLDVHHSYDPVTRTLYYGDGSKESQAPVGLASIAGDSKNDYPTDPPTGPADQLSFLTPNSIGYGPNGDLYVADSSRHRVWRIDSSGQYHLFAGSTRGATGPGDGGPATAAKLDSPEGVAVGADGSVYIAEAGDSGPYADGSFDRIRVVGADGIIETFAGRAAPGTPYQQEVQAVGARITDPSDLAVGPDGSVYFVEDGLTVRQITPDGRIHKFFGGSPLHHSGVYSGDPTGVDVADDGTVYITDYDNELSDGGQLISVSPDGRVRRVAGAGVGYTGDGGPASAAYMKYTGDVAVDSHGNVFFIDQHKVVRRVTPDGIIDTVSGQTGSCQLQEGAVARGGCLQLPVALDISPEDELTISSWSGERILRATEPMSSYYGEEITLRSPDGLEVYTFSPTGRHEETRSGLTGALLFSFDYTPAGTLDTITDGDGNVTTVERDVEGEPTAIIAPHGQRTELTTDAGGNIDSVTDPAGNEFSMDYNSGGLLEAFADPRDHTSEFTYNADGRLTRDDDPADGYKTLSRDDGIDGFTVEHETKLGRTTTYDTRNRPDRSVRRRVTTPDGAETETVTSEDGSRVETTAPDGTEVTSVMSGDSQFGSGVPFASSVTTILPNEDSLTVTTESETTPDGDLFDREVTKTIDGRTSTYEFDADTFEATATSPEGRVATSVIDEQGRLLSEDLPDIEESAYDYDEEGRLEVVTQGTREWSYAYDEETGYLESATDPLDRTTEYSYDDAGRLISEELPGGRTVGFSYDPDGNLTSVTPPGRDPHEFNRDAREQPGDYTPPDVGDGADPTSYEYNDDRQLTTINRPDGTEVTMSYGPTSGQLETLEEPGGPQTAYTYDPASGRLDGIASPGGVGLELSQNGPLPTGLTLTGPVAGSVSVSYDESFRPDEIEVNGDDPVAYSYDDDDLITEAGDLEITPDPGSGMTAATSIGEIETASTYNGYGELETETAEDSASTLYSATYTRDEAGRVETKSETTPAATTTWEYGYDDAGRLEEVERNGSPYASYGYDQNSNRTSATTPGGTTAATYDGQDRIETYGDLEYELSKNGQLESVTDSSSSDVTTYGYDALGNLDSVELPDSTEIDYLTDGLGRRVGKKVDGDLVEGYLYEGASLNPIAVLDENGDVAERFVYGTDPHVPDYMVKGSGTYRIISDQLGSPRLLVDVSTGSIAQRIEYGPFGEVLADTNPGFQPFGFAGGLYDAETGLVRFGARDYDAEIGRWTARDPIGFGGGQANLFGYVGANPVGAFDMGGTDVLGVDLGPIDDVTGAIAGTIGEIPNSISSGASGEFLMGEGVGAFDLLTLGRYSDWIGVDTACLSGYTTGQVITVGVPGLRGAYALMSRARAAFGGVRGGEVVSASRGAGGGPNWRIAPFGHRGGPWYRSLPHYHRRGPGGIGRHRPWESGPGGFGGRF